MKPRTSLFPYVAAVLSVTILTIFAAAPAHAQATRTWISGVGDDVNPCSRTAPCKTFQGAISKTAAGGEIDCLDPGGFGGVTITKAMTLDCGSGETGSVGSILVGGTPGITVNAGATDRVIIRKVSINGASQTSNPGTIGINFIAGLSLTVDNVNIMNFSNLGISFQPSVRASLVVINSNIENATNGGIISSATSGGVNRVNVMGTHIHRSGPAITAGLNTDALIWNSFLSNNAGGGLLVNDATAQATVDLSTISNNQAFGVHATNNGIVRLANTSVSFNNGTGLLADTGGQILTWSNNWVAGNAADGARTGTIVPQ